MFFAHFLHFYIQTKQIQFAYHKYVFTSLYSIKKTTVKDTVVKGMAEEWLSLNFFAQLFQKKILQQVTIPTTNEEAAKICDNFRYLSGYFRENKYFLNLLAGWLPNL